MRVIGIGLTAAVMLASSALAQEQPGAGVDMAGFRGDCKLTSAGKTVACESVIYMHFRANGRTNFGAVVDEDTMTSFSGGNDDQPKRTEYWLEVDRVLQGRAGEVSEFPGKGRCDLKISEDGSIVHELVCRAMIEGGPVELRFSGSRSN